MSRMLGKRLGPTILVVGAFVGSCCARELPIRMVAQAQQSNNQKSCILSLINEDEFEVLSSIWIAGFNEGVEVFRTGPATLQRGQALILKVAVEASVVCEGPSVFYQLSYERAGVRNELIRSTAAIRPRDTVNGLWGTLAGGLIGFVSAIVGAWANHALTIARERRSSQKERFDLLAGAVNRFLVSWDRSITAQELHTHFEELRHLAVLDHVIVDRYRATIGRLADSEVSIQEKRDDAALFERDVREYLRRLDPDKSSA